MKKMIIFLIVASSMSFASNERVIDKSFDVNADVAFSIDNHKGKLVINTHAGNTVEINARIYMDDASGEKLSNGDLQEVLDSVEIRFDATARRVRVTADKEKAQELSQGFFGKNRPMPFIDYNILIPEGASLTVETHKGSVDISAPSGQVDIDSHKGEGKIQRVRNTLNLESHKGTFTVGIDAVADISVESHKGNVTLNMPGGDYTLSGQSHKGNIEVNGRKAQFEREKKSLSVSLKEGAGTYDVSLETHKGNIIVNIED